MTALFRHGFSLRAACALALTCAACGPQLDLGTNVTWATNHESGTLDDWLSAPGGGTILDASNSTVEVVAGPAHSGKYALKLTDLGASDVDGPGVYRELIDPDEAYYSAWYYLPRAYTTNSQWTIQKFRSRLESDPTVVSHGHDLDLRTLPGGQVVLFVFSHDPAYLQAPLADPPAFVPIEAWFQIEVLYRSRTDETGRLLVWIDDRLVYDLENRRTAGSGDLLWSPCSVGLDVQPMPREVYIDDAAISRVRVGRAGKLF